MFFRHSSNAIAGLLVDLGCHKLPNQINQLTIMFGLFRLLSFATLISIGHVIKKTIYSQPSPFGLGHDRVTALTLRFFCCRASKVSEISIRQALVIGTSCSAANS
jgi:hypothetical protein